MKHSLPLILLIEDDPNDQELARIALEQSNIPHQLIVAHDGAEAVAWLTNMGSEEVPLWPRLILLDLKLPKMSGLDVLTYINTGEKTRLLPVVVFTSSAEECDQLNSYDKGANAFVQKPIDFNEYREAISDMGRFWIQHNQVPPTAPSEELKIS